ncbi:hypothetical protein [uncultured Thalassospira sp.]|uniref:hypothetical protein n=1 Tax=uncultured Thalassospira sp. TaxID=404382 RepID=UPI0030DA04EE|tara:strand:- start:13260 stop:13934 length:675 start_codon:yes stop_codon:yes gene_type:complete
MTIKRLREQPNIFYIVVAALVVFATAIAIFGVVFDTMGYCDNGAICRFARRFQWETLCAGLYGLAGGLAVIASSKEQIANAKEGAIKELLFDVDTVILAAETRIEEIKDALNMAEKANTSDDAPQREKAQMSMSGKGDLAVRAREQIARGHTLPHSLKDAAASIYKPFNPFWKLGKPKASTDYTYTPDLAEDVAHYRKCLLRAQDAVTKLVAERDHYAEVLRKR